MKILVISSYFGPETTVGVLRVNAFVKYWAREGHDIHVVTMPFSGRLPDGLDGGISIFQVAPFLIGARKSGESQGYAKGASGLKRRIVEFQYWLKRHFLSNYLDPRILWWPKVSNFVKSTLLPNNDYDVIYSTVPSYTAHSAASAIKSVSPDSFWVADYRDLWSGNPIFPGCGLVRAIERRHERFVLRAANLVVSINESLVDELRALHGGDRYLIVPNGFDDSEVEDAHGKGEGAYVLAERPRISLIYTGTILPRYQDPSPLFQAIKDLAAEGEISPGDLEVRFYGDYSELDRFQLTHDPTVLRFILKSGKLSREKILSIQKQADFLLFFGYKPVVEGVGSTTGTVSGKIFEYLVSSTEILAVGVTNEMIVAEILARSRAGDYYGDDVEKIKSRIRRALLDGNVPKVVPDMAYLDQFRRSRLARTLLGEIERRSGRRLENGSSNSQWSA